MVQVIEDTDIDHLDFDFDEDDLHYAHPTDTTLSWCGRKNQGLPRKFSEHKITFKIECPECLRLSRTENWWKIHNKYFGSHCHGGVTHGSTTFHNCGA